MSGISSSKPKTVFRLENKFETQARSRLIDFFLSNWSGESEGAGFEEIGGFRLTVSGATGSQELSRWKAYLWNHLPRFGSDN